MDPTQNNDMNQVGPGTNTTPIQSGNMLTPQQKYQMAQYANSLMTNQGSPPVGSVGAGIGELGKALMGGYLMNQAMPMGATPPQGGSSPMQLPSAGGGSPSSIISGLFPGVSQ
jgi:hypothetical protein